MRDVIKHDLPFPFLSFHFLSKKNIELIQYCAVGYKCFSAFVSPPLGSRFVFRIFSVVRMCRSMDPKLCDGRFDVH